MASIEVTAAMAAVLVSLVLTLAVFLGPEVRTKEVKKVIYQGVVKKVKESDSGFEETREFKKAFKKAVKNYNLAPLSASPDDVAVCIIISHVAKTCAIAA